ncbi:hypothetical protein [Streptomonospora salina]|uniref:hypothetical protein n=1 Tax=Streptomonospora salina TaxID=104205 RepID=UPI00161897FA
MIALSAVVLALGLTSVPAAAHTLHSAVTSSVGCGWDGDYEVLEHSDVTAFGERLGRVYLLWNDAGTRSGHNCVVTRKFGVAHGTASYASAALGVQGRDNPPADHDDDYGHYSAVTDWARGHCVNYRGWVEHPETGAMGIGGDQSWQYCS